MDTSEYGPDDGQEHDDPFLRAVRIAAGERLEGAFTGMPEVIGALNRQQLGRPLAMWGIEDDDVEKEIIGYCLPLDEEQTQHLVAFESGRICQIGAVGDSAAFREYRNRFSPNERPIAIDADDAHDAELRFMHQFEKRCTVTLLRNDEPSHEALFGDMFVRAWETANSIKTKREDAQRRTAQQFVQLFGGKLELTILDPLAEDNRKP